MFALILLAACGIKEDAGRAGDVTIPEAADPVPAEEDMTDPAQADMTDPAQEDMTALIKPDDENPAFSYYEVKEEFVSQDGLITTYYEAKIPQLNIRSVTAGKINNRILESYKAQIEHSKKEAGDYINWYEEDKEEYPGDSAIFSYSNEIGYRITYYTDKYLSILKEGYEYMGGAHGMPYRDVLIFNMETGEEVRGEELFAADREAFRQIRRDAFAAVIDQGTEAGYWEDALDIVEQTEDYYENGYYLTEDGVTFYYSPYELAPFAAGFIEASVPYEQLPLK